MTFFTELTRRKVFKVGGAYLVVAWLAVQAASIGFPAFDAPPWALRIFILVALLGFPVSLVFAWAFELTPDGVKSESGARSTRAILAVAAVLTGLAFVWYFKGQPSYRADTPPAAAAAAPAAPAGSINQKSIAVLPFSDLSPAHDQDYFSDGMAEEILNALAQVKDMKVAGRTSSFYYKGKNEDLRAIGKALGVANILEGSVRKQGDKVRITAQLIRSDDDFHLWSQAYDGDLSDVFQLQERIARAITDQLKVVLSDDQKTHLVLVGTSNGEAYTLYLQATAALNQRDYPKMGEAIGWLDKALQLDPNFARAHARLAMMHVIGQSPYGASESEAEKHALAALALDPKLAEPYNALAFLARKHRHYTDARVAMDSALAREPDDAGVIFYDAQLLINTGYTRRGIERLDRALAIDPLLPNALHWRAQQFLFAGDTDMAERLWKRAEQAGLFYADAGFSQVAKARGDFATARLLTTSRMLANPGAIVCLKAPAQSLPIYVEGANGGDAAARTKALAVVDECIAAKPEKLPIWVPLGLRELGQPERALQMLAQGPTYDDAGVLNYFWSPKWQDVRHLPGFAEFARSIGFAALWDKNGAPDLCHRNAGDDYVCD
jgi:TolB-like protein